MYGGRAPPNGELCNKVQCMYVCTCTSNWFFKNQPDEICSRLSERASEKAGVLSPRSSKRERRKERAWKKGGEEKKKFCTLSFFNGYFGEIFCRKKAVSSEGPSGDNVFKNTARHTPLAHLPLCTLKVSPTFCISTVFNFFWDGCNTQEKWKKKVMQNFGGQIRCIREMYKWRIQHLINMCVFRTLNWPKNLLKMYCFSFPIIFHNIFFNFFLTFLYLKKQGNNQEAYPRIFPKVRIVLKLT